MTKTIWEPKTTMTRRTAPFNPGRSLLSLPELDDFSQIDIAVFGIPFDGHTIGRDGARDGPAAIRQHSFNIRHRNVETGLAPLALARAADIGDAPVNPLDPDHSLALITKYCQRITDAGLIPLAAGGDHGVSLPMLRAVGKAHGPVGVIHFDAHPDTYDDIIGNRYNHATPFRRAVEEGLVDPKKHVMIGIRGTLPMDTEPLDWAAAQGMTILYMQECIELGPTGIVEKIRAAIGADHPTYVTLDVDCVDPHEIPGTGSPEPGGLTMREMLQILRGLRGMNLVGADVNEVAPQYDPTGLSALQAAHLMNEILGLLAERHAASTG